MNDLAWEPWKRGTVVKVRNVEGFDGDYIIEADVAMPPTLPDSITLRLTPVQLEPWDETVLAMRASAGKSV